MNVDEKLQNNLNNLKKLKKRMKKQQLWDW